MSFGNQYCLVHEPFANWNHSVFGYEEPQKNYEPNGRETPEELEQVLVNVASKVGVTIDPANISDGFRLGKKPNGSPLRRNDGTFVARPILFKLNKRSKKSELLRKKKTLIETQIKNIRGRNSSSKGIM